MKKVIINADDFGLTSGCNRGIIKAFKEGIVTSATVMMNMPKNGEAIIMARDHGINALGVHLNITAGRPLLPVSKVPSLVCSQGAFYKDHVDFAEPAKIREVEQEFREQIHAFLKTGLQLTHLDSHHHLHMRAGVSKIVVELALEHGVPMRKITAGTSCNNQEAEREQAPATPDHLITEFYDEGVSRENLQELLSKAPGHIIEVMTHPGLSDDELKRASVYTRQREKELEILTSREMIDWIQTQDLELVSFLYLK